MKRRSCAGRTYPSSENTVVGNARAERGAAEMKRGKELSLRNRDIWVKANPWFPAESHCQVCNPGGRSGKMNLGQETKGPLGANEKKAPAIKKVFSGLGTLDVGSPCSRHYTGNKVRSYSMTGRRDGGAKRRLTRDKGLRNL